MGECLFAPCHRAEDAVLELSLVPLGWFPRYLIGGSPATSEEVCSLPQGAFLSVPILLSLSAFFGDWGLLS